MENNEKMEPIVEETFPQDDVVENQGETAPVTSFENHYETFLKEADGSEIFRRMIDKVALENPSLTIADISQILINDCAKGKLELSDDYLLHVAASGSPCGKVLLAYLPDDVLKIIGNLPSSDLTPADFETFGNLTIAFVWEVIHKIRSRREEDNSLVDLIDAMKSIGVEGLSYPLSLDKNPNETVIAATTENSNGNPIMTAFMAYEVTKGNFKLTSTAPVQEEKEPEKPAVELDPRYAQIVNDKVTDIMAVYDRLYGGCYENIPLGILTSQGILFNPPNCQIDISSAAYAMNFFSATDGVFKLGSENFPDKMPPSNADEFLSHTFYPVYHLHNIFGYVDESGNRYNSWKDASKIIKKNLFNLISSLFVSYTGGNFVEFGAEIQTRLTDCIIVNEFSVNGMMEFTYHKQDAGRAVFGDCTLPHMSKIIGKSTGEKISEPGLGFDVYKFMYVGDGDAYNKEVLFAFKAYEKMIASNTPVSSKNIVLGKNLKNGMSYTANFASPQQIFATIMAGSGSGKGVLTLSILAGLLAAGHPVAYIDFKPDMAAMLWNMERSMNKNGANVRILAIDGATNMDKYGTMPVRNYSHGIHGEVFNENEKLQETLTLIPYLKMIQMSCVMAGLRAKGQDIGTKSKLFFIMDEAEQANVLYDSMLNALNSYKPPKAKKDEPLVESPYDKAMQKMKRIFQDDILRGLRYCGNTSGRVGEVGYVYIGQATDPNTWKSGTSGDWKYSLFGFPVGKTSLKLMGKGIGRNSIYAITKDKFDGDTRLNNLGYWAVSKTASSGSDKNTVAIKSYMVLNENDYPKENGFADSLLKNLDETTRDRVIRNDLTMGDGVTVRESAGFYGLMKMLVNGDEQRLIDSMSSMYNLVENILVKAGILSALGYRDVEEYLYSCDPASFFTINEIRDAYINGGIVIASDNEDDELAKLEAEFKEELDSLEEERISAGYSDEEYQDLKDEILEKQRKQREELEARKGQHTEGGAGSNPFGYGTMGGAPTGASPIGSTGATTPTGFTGSPTGATSPAGSTGFGGASTPVPPISDARDSSVPNTASAYTQENSVHIPMPTDPFNTLGRSGSPMSCINAFKSASATILNAIKEQFGSLSRIYSVHIANDGLVVINEVKFMPTFDVEFIQSLPVDMQGEVSSGKIAQLFYFGDMYKFSNLNTFIVDNTRLAEQRIRTEMGVRGNWDSLFNKFNNLQTLIIGGVNMGDDGAAQDYEDNDRGGFGLRDKLANFFGLDDSNSWTGRLWKSKPVRTVGKIFGGALGATMGVKLLMGACTIFGPWGLLFSAFAVGGAVHEYKKNNPRGGYSNNNGSGTATRTTSNKRKNNNNNSR